MSEDPNTKVETTVSVDGEICKDSETSSHAKANKETDTENGRTDREPQLRHLVEDLITRGELELAYDQYGEAIAIVRGMGEMVIFGVESKTFKLYLQRLAYRANKTVSAGKLDELIGMLCAQAKFDGKACTLEIRVAGRGDCIFYDLGNGSVVQVSRLGWSIDSRSPVLFRRYSIALRQVEPEKGGRLDWLLDLFEVRDRADRILLAVYVVAAFIPNIPHPICVPHGPQGSAKTTFLRFLVELIDPSHVHDVQLGDVSQFLQAASHRWLVPLDNLSYIRGDHSDLLCKLVTGTGIAKRALYTNDDDFFRSLRRVIVMNGLTVTPEKADLLDRCLLIAFDRIPDDKRRPEADVLQDFESQKAKLLGACFDALSKAMAIKEGLKFSKLPRMADFAAWGAAIAIALGYSQEEFFEAYEQNRGRQVEESLESSPVAAVVMHFLRSHPVLSGTTSEVHKVVLEHAEAAGIDGRSLPRNPKSFGRAIVEITPSLVSLGYCVNKIRRKSRLIEILPPANRPVELVQEVETASLAPTPSLPSTDGAVSVGKLGSKDGGSESC